MMSNDLIKLLSIYVAKSHGTRRATKSLAKRQKHLQQSIKIQKKSQLDILCGAPRRYTSVDGRRFVSRKGIHTTVLNIYFCQVVVIEIACFASMGKADITE